MQIQSTTSVTKDEKHLELLNTAAESMNENQFDQTIQQLWQEISNCYSSCLKVVNVDLLVKVIYKLPIENQHFVKATKILLEKFPQCQNPRLAEAYGKLLTLQLTTENKDFTFFQQVVTLNMRNQGIRRLSSKFSSIHLQHLDISGNHLSELPDPKNFPNVKNLVINDNKKILDLTGIKEYKKLETLSLQRTVVTNSNDLFATSVKTLHISGTGIGINPNTQFPLSLEDITLDLLGYSEFPKNFLKNTSLKKITIIRAPLLTKIKGKRLPNSIETIVLDKKGEIKKVSRSLKKKVVYLK